MPSGLSARNSSHTPNAFLTAQWVSEGLQLLNSPTRHSACTQQHSGCGSKWFKQACKVEETLPPFHSKCSSSLTEALGLGEPPAPLHPCVLLSADYQLGKGGSSTRRPASCKAKRRMQGGARKLYESNSSMPGGLLEQHIGSVSSQISKKRSRSALPWVALKLGCLQGPGDTRLQGN